MFEAETKEDASNCFGAETMTNMFSMYKLSLYIWPQGSHFS